MALSNAQRQEALRERRAELGILEVRGVYLPQDMHATLKTYAKRLMKKRDAETMRKRLRKRKKKSR